jgi:hypothetical protein
LQPQLQLSGGASASTTNDLPTISPFSNIEVKKSNGSNITMDKDEAKELESGDDFIHVSVRFRFFFNFWFFKNKLIFSIIGD